MIQIPQRSDPSPRPFRSARPKTSTHSSWPELWADRTAWPIGNRTPYDELAELAVMSALGSGSDAGNRSPFTARCSPAQGRKRQLGRSATVSK
jgi:hypothetical protein